MNLNMKKILMIALDAISMVLIGYFSYFLADMILGTEGTLVFVEKWYIFVPVKLVMYFVFRMYDMSSLHSRLLDVAGILVTDAFLIALAKFAFKMSVKTSLIQLLILVLWDILIGFMVRYLFRTEESFKHQTDDDNDDYDDFDADDFLRNADDSIYVDAKKDISEVEVELPRSDCSDVSDMEDDKIETEKNPDDDEVQRTEDDNDPADEVIDTTDKSKEFFDTLEFLVSDDAVDDSREIKNVEMHEKDNTVKLDDMDNDDLDIMNTDIDIDEDMLSSIIDELLPSENVTDNNVEQDILPDIPAEEPKVERKTYKAESVGKKMKTEQTSFDQTQLVSQLNSKLDMLLNMMDEKDKRISALEEKLASQAYNISQLEQTRSRDRYQDDMRNYDPYIRREYQQSFISDPRSAYPYYERPRTYINKNDILDSIIADIKSLYTTLMNKTAEVEKREKDILIKTLELEQLQKRLNRNLDSEMEEIRTDIQNIVGTDPGYTEEDLLPKKDITISDKINKAIDSFEAPVKQSFVLAEEPDGRKDTETTADTEPSRDIYLDIERAEAERREKEAILEAEQRALDEQRRLKQEELERQEAELIRQKQELEAQIQAEKEKAQTEQKEESRQEMLARRQQDRLKRAIAPSIGDILNDPKASGDDLNDIASMKIEDPIKEGLDINDINNLSSFIETL